MSENETNQQEQAPVEVSGEALAEVVLAFFNRPNSYQEREAFLKGLAANKKGHRALIDGLMYEGGLRRDGEFLAGMLSSFVNGSGRRDNKVFVEKVMSDHRTLQQATMKLFLGCIAGWAEAHDKGWYDLRNEMTCKLAKEIVQSQPNLFIEGEAMIPII